MVRLQRQNKATKPAGSGVEYDDGGVREQEGLGLTGPTQACLVWTGLEQWHR
jgi:hypothetical protein